MAMEVFAAQEDLLGEGPVWCEPERALYWLDIGRRRLYRQGLAGARTHWDLPHRPGCIERLTDASLIIALGEGLHRFDQASGTATLIKRVSLSSGVRFNEGKADPSGRFWFGSMQDNFGPSDEPVAIRRKEGALFRFDGVGSVAVMEQGIGISNTLAWSPEGSRFYFADSLLDQIFVYDYEACSGNVARKRLFFQGSGQGLPDGSAIDVEGCLWNARWGAGRVLRITPEGQVDRSIEMPALQPTSCAFGGGRKLDTLFVTSARNGMDAGSLDQSPLSGSVFAITGLAQGMPVPAVRLEAR